ncbi:LCP family protein [Georgenia thermotolerans]|uniref:LCP family protein n=1 Tax=Georgenia thermotolerans TaxID=527326 RepID=UPI00147814A1|nr:LCP family protein [Georgenia thermotolerans]
MTKASRPVPNAVGPATPSGPPLRHARPERRHPLLSRLGLAALALVLGLVGAGALAYRHMQGNVQRHDITSLLGGDRPGGAAAAPIDPKAGQALTFLVLGSDSRAGGNNDNSGITGMRADTTMLVHVAADRSRLEVVSIPRDTLVDIPSCTLPGGRQTRAETGAMINSAFSIGGQTGDVGAAAACSIRTVEKLTGVRVDDFVVVDFAGFTRVVDALGGVPMDVPQPIDDKRADVKLAAGCQVLNGHDALGFARVRKSLGDGSDISRIGRQQELVAAIAREALGKNLLTDLPSLYRFLDATTKTLVTGPEIGQLSTMAGLANSLRRIAPENIVFTTMPFEWAGPRVRPAPAAGEVWDALRADKPVPGTVTAGGTAPATAAPGGGAGASATPAAPKAAGPSESARGLQGTPAPVCRK